MVLVGVSRLWPMGSAGPAVCFCVAYKLRRVFTFSDGWKNTKRRVLSHDVKILCNSGFKGP